MLYIKMSGQVTFTGPYCLQYKGTYTASNGAVDKNIFGHTRLSLLKIFHYSFFCAPLKLPVATGKLYLELFIIAFTALFLMSRQLLITSGVV